MFTATAVLTLLGFSLGGLLGFAAKKLASGEENPLLDEIEAMLPGSQCGQCGFPGCRPAAEAVINGDTEITFCPPGGRALVESLAERLGIDVNTIGATPAPLIASIEGTLCTGCTRCFKACPTDAIVGANKQIHVVISKACTGCSKCKDACPENCIDLQPQGEDLDNWHWPKPQVA